MRRGKCFDIILFSFGVIPLNFVSAQEPSCFNIFSTIYLNTPDSWDQFIVPYDSLEKIPWMHFKYYKIEGKVHIVVLYPLI